MNQCKKLKNILNRKKKRWRKKTKAPTESSIKMATIASQTTDLSLGKNVAFFLLILLFTPTKENSEDLISSEILLLRR